MQLIQKLSERFSRATPTEILNNMQFFSGLGDSAWLLYALCRSKKPQVCVEIGSARGKSACYIGMALKENGKGHLYAIDPHTSTAWNDSESVDTYDIVRNNLNQLGLQSVVSIVRKLSSDALKDWHEKIDIIFIDGDHSYEGVKADWEGFRPYMSEFGIVVFHDTLWELRPDPKWSRSDMGVPKFVEELRLEGYPVLTIDQDCGVSLVQPRKNGVSLVR